MSAEHASFAEVPSALGGTGLGAVDRVDPYWGGMWASGSGASWTTCTSARQMVDAGLAHGGGLWGGDRQESLDALLAPANVERSLRALAVVDAWRTVSVEQLAAFTGDPTLLSGRSVTLARAFCAGLLDVGRYTTMLRATAHGSARARVLRPSATKVFDRDVAPRVTYSQWVRTSGGRPWRAGSQFDRHNLLTTELALRAAEWCEIGTVLGEKHAQVVDLTSHGATPGSQEHGSPGKVADAVLVRSDGMRVAVETTSHTSASFARKVDAWARVLSSTPLSDSGLVVVFVAAPRPGRHTPGLNLVTEIRQAVAEAVKRHPGPVSDPVSERIAVMDWAGWFPGPGLVDSSWLSLDAYRPTGAWGTSWERVGLLDVVDVPFRSAGHHDPAAVLANADLLWSTPYWLRSPEPGVRLWPLSLQASGSLDVPVPAGTTASRPTGAARGAAGRAGVPAAIAG